MTIAHGAIRISGLREFQKALKAADGESQKQLRVVLNGAAQTVVGGAKPLIPRRSGAAAATVKVASSQREARVKAGSSSARYLPWLEFGGRVGINNSVKRPFIKEGRYIFPTYKARKPEIQDQLQEGISSLIKRSGLG